MIQLGPYDAHDKWEVVCRAWEGGELDLGVDRMGRPCVRNWCSEAFIGGRDHFKRFLRFPRVSKAHTAFAASAQGMGYEAFIERALALIEEIRLRGFDAASADLPPPLIARIKGIFRFGAMTQLRYTEDIGEIPDIDTLREYRRPFPCGTLRGKRNVLDIFCARQYGILDAIHVYDYHPDNVTMVDADPETMAVMQTIYPAEWIYACGDYKDFLKAAEERGLSYDLIICDTTRSMCSEVAFDMLPTIAGLCTCTIVMHYCTEQFEELGTGPDDFVPLSAAIKRRTGIAVTVTGWTVRSVENGCLTMRVADLNGR